MPRSVEMEQPLVRYENLTAEIQALILDVGPSAYLGHKDRLRLLNTTGLTREEVTFLLKVKLTPMLEPKKDSDGTMERLISIIEYEAGRLQVADVKLSPKAVGTRIGLDKAQLVFIYVTGGRAALDFFNIGKVHIGRVHLDKNGLALVTNSTRADWSGITPDFEFRQVELSLLPL